jgi:hypothetical protein
MDIQFQNQLLADLYEGKKSLINVLNQIQL